MSGEPLAVVIVDDHPLFRKGLRALLGTLAGVRVVGEASSGMEAVRLAAELTPDVMLMDLHMPGGDGLSAVRTIAAAHPAIRMLVVTMFQDDESVFAAMRAGARGYVLKDMDDDIGRAILAVGRGDTIFSPAIAARMMTFFAAQPAQAGVLFPALSDSERKVLRLMAQGVNNQGIAEGLALSPKTVRNYISSIFTKLQVADRAQAIVRARDAGFH